MKFEFKNCIYIYIYVCMHVCMYVCMCIYVCMYVLVMNYRLFIYHVKATKQLNLAIKLNKKLNIHSKHIK